MKHLRSRDDWKAFAEESDRRRRSFEVLYCGASNLLGELDAKLGVIHSLLTTAMSPDIVAMISGIDPKSIPPHGDLIGMAEEKMEELRSFLAVESDPSALIKRGTG